MREAITEEDLQRYAVEGSNADFQAALGGPEVAPASGTVSVQKKGPKTPGHIDKSRLESPSNMSSMYKKVGKKQKRDPARGPAKKLRT